MHALYDLAEHADKAELLAGYQLLRIVNFLVHFGDPEPRASEGGVVRVGGSIPSERRTVSSKGFPHISAPNQQTTLAGEVPAARSY